jgi:quercetin dioxygenase-like cupin family protein
MENKSNHATPLRPEGDRILDAPLVVMELENFMSQLRNEPKWNQDDHNSLTIFKSENMRIVLIGLHEGAELKTHTANGIISVQVIEGHIKFTAQQQIVDLQKGQVLALHKNIPHAVLALKETFFLLTLAVA